MTSVVGTTRRCSTPANFAAQGSQSTGIRSIEFIRKIQTKSVSASGAMTRLLGGWLKVSLTLRSTNPTDDLDEGLELARHAGRRLLGDAAEEEDEDDAEQDGEEHRVDVDREEIAVAFVPDPLAVLLADGQVLEVVADVLAS